MSFGNSRENAIGSINQFFDGLAKGDSAEKKRAYDGLLLHDRALVATVYNSREKPQGSKNSTLDCLNRSQLAVSSVPYCGVTVATICSPGFESQADGLFSTLRKFGGLGNVRLALVCVNDTNGSCAAVAHKHGAVVVRAQSFGRVNASIKAALYSLPTVLAGEYFICLDSDIFITGDLSPLVGAMYAAPDSHILACRAASDMPDDRPRSLYYVAEVNYGSRACDADYLMGFDPDARGRFVRLNSGVYAGHRHALVAVERQLRALQPYAVPFVEAGTTPAADELAWSVAIAQLGNLNEIDEIFNLQMYAREAKVVTNSGKPVAWCKNGKARVLHFAAPAGRAKMAQFNSFLHYRETL